MFIPHMSHVMCHVSYVRCHVSGVQFQVSHARCKFFIFFSLDKDGVASWLRVCYQWGLPFLVCSILAPKLDFALKCVLTTIFLNFYILIYYYSSFFLSELMKGAMSLETRLMVRRRRKIRNVKESGKEIVKERKKRKS